MLNKVLIANRGEIAADKTGTVSEVTVESGQSVGAGDVVLLSR